MEEFSNIISLILYHLCNYQTINNRHAHANAHRFEHMHNNAKGIQKQNILLSLKIQIYYVQTFTKLIP